MKRQNIMRFNCLLVLMALSQFLYSQYNSSKTDTIAYKSVMDREVMLTFDVTGRKTTGSVTVIDVREELKRDQNRTIGEILNGKVPGLFGNFNTWGTGTAILLVDGIRQNEFYINSLNPLEVQSIVVLKDAMSKALYGAQGDKGVILITTMRGNSGRHRLRIAGQYTYETPVALPKYLSSADYMERYNEAQLNDGIDPASLRYTQAAIDATRQGENPARYPDNNFFSRDYIKNFTSGANLFADVSGGDDKTRYYVNTGWNRSSGWLNTPQGDITDYLNYRGNLDFEINEYVQMSINTTARLAFNKQPNAGSIWTTASTELPNNYPVLWDPGIIQDEAFRNSIVSDANLASGKLLGGNSSYLDNVYGTFTQNGNKKLMQRDVQFSGKLNVDMPFIMKGLSASFYAGMNFFNMLYASQAPTFTVYEPVFDELSGILDTVLIHGKDKAANNYITNEASSDFFRHSTYYATLNYNHSFGNHEISAVGMVFNDLITHSDLLQKDVIFHTGFSANYIYSDKYIAELSLMGIGSRKLKEGSRIEMAPSVGLGWVLSEEEFLSGISAIDYLKIRSSFGISKNDNWDNYNLYRNTFARGNNFTYQNGVSQNAVTNFSSVSNDVSLQKRRDFTVGIDAAIFKKALNLNVTYFSSASLDSVTLMSSTFPQIIGYENMVYQNYNSNLTRGVEMGINYRFLVLDDFSITAGGNLMHITPKITKHEEPEYELLEGKDRELLRKGTATDAIWALLSDGLYNEADFNPNGSLVSGLPVPTFGTVKPGDIKYLDQNGDNIIDQRDERIIGHGVRNQFSLFLDINFRNFEFYVLGVGQAGDYNYRTGNYYRVFGNVKYSEVVNEAYSPSNKNVNASHPRLSTTDASNNVRNSDFWLYKNDSFVIPSMQLTYHFSGANKFSFLHDSEIYIRAANALVFGENYRKYTQVNVGAPPKTRVLAIGLVTSF